jgi:hypothetical protein
MKKGRAFALPLAHTLPRVFRQTDDYWSAGLPTVAAVPLGSLRITPDSSVKNELWPEDPGETGIPVTV